MLSPKIASGVNGVAHMSTAKAKARSSPEGLPGLLSYGDVAADGSDLVRVPNNRPPLDWPPLFPQHWSSSPRGGVKLKREDVLGRGRGRSREDVGVERHNGVVLPL